MMYLPTDAHVIVIGPCESQERHDGFEELDDCFGNVGYLTLHRYRSKADECKVRYERWPNGKRNKNLVASMRWWDSDRYPQALKQGDLIELASSSLARAK